jgi:hypothetical protein
VVYKFSLLFVSDVTSPVGQGLLLHEVSRLHTKTHHGRWDSPGRVISSSQKPLLDNTQHSQDTDVMPPVRFEPTNPTGKQPQTYVLDRAATWTSPDST